MQRKALGQQHTSCVGRIAGNRMCQQAEQVMAKDGPGVGHWWTEISQGHRGFSLAYSGKSLGSFEQESDGSASCTSIMLALV